MKKSLILIAKSLILAASALVILISSQSLNAKHTTHHCNRATQTDCPASKMGKTKATIPYMPDMPACPVNVSYNYCSGIVNRGECVKNWSEAVKFDNGEYKFIKCLWDNNERKCKDGRNMICMKSKVQKR